MGIKIHLYHTYIHTLQYFIAHEFYVKASVTSKSKDNQYIFFLFFFLYFLKKVSQNKKKNEC